MSIQVQLRRGTATNIASFAGAIGEVVADTTNERLVLCDGSTAGGFPAAKLSEVLTNASGAANRVMATPNGGSGAPSLRALVGADLPAPGVSTLGGVLSASAPATQYQTGIDTSGNPIFAQPAFTDLSGTSALHVAAGVHGSSTEFGIAETILSPLSGANATATTFIPAGAIVFAVGSRVTTTITGATTFTVGVSGALSQFGSGIALASGTTNAGRIAPALFASATSVIVTATGSNFTAGAVRLSVHYMLTIPPTS